MLYDILPPLETIERIPLSDLPEKLDELFVRIEQYGERVLGIGGMDKTALRKDKAAVDAEIQRMKRLASLGGFIPCPDHRLMPGTKFELVQYYAEEIKKIKL